MNRPVREVALERLDRLVGEWTFEAIFPSAPTVVQRGGRGVFEWMRGGQLLVQRIEAPIPDVPDSIAIIAFDPEKGQYTQHYFDSRGVIRLYAMEFDGRTWTLLRNTPDFSLLNFAQRYVGTLSDDGNTIQGMWEKSTDGQTWAHDFALTYRKTS
jgi:hypothetical protein